MITIQINVTADGGITASKLDLGVAGEHNLTNLLVTVDNTLYSSVSYYRIEFFNHYSEKLTANSEHSFTFAVPQECLRPPIVKCRVAGYNLINGKVASIYRSKSLCFKVAPSENGMYQIDCEKVDELEKTLAEFSEATSTASRMASEALAAAASANIAATTANTAAGEAERMTDNIPLAIASAQTYCGAYDNNTTYVRGNIVFTSKGDSYILTVASSKGISPETSSNWVATAKNDARYKDVEEKLANKADLSALNSVAEGSPHGVYATLTALQADTSADKSRIYLVSENGKWYYHNGTDWCEGGIYQSEQIENGSVLYSSLEENLKQKVLMSPYICYDRSTLKQFMTENGMNNLIWLNMDNSVDYYLGNRPYSTYDVCYSLITNSILKTMYICNIKNVLDKSSGAGAVYRTQRGSMFAVKDGVRDSYIPDVTFIQTGENPSVSIYKVNIFDGQMETGTIATATGVSMPATTKIRSTNYTPVAEGVSYSFSSSDSLAVNIVFYDKDYSFVSSAAGVLSGKTFTAPIGACYLKFVCSQTSITNPQIEVGSATEYVPYTEPQTQTYGKLFSLSGKYTIVCNNCSLVYKYPRDLQTIIERLEEAAGIE